MPGNYFVVQNGLQVGPLTIDALSGDIQTSGNVNITGNLGVSQIAKNDSSVVINDTGGSSSIVFAVDGTTEHTMTSTLATLASNVSITDIGYLKVPVGTTGQRPGSPSAGMIRYNSTQSSFEGYGSAWASLGGVKSIDQLTYIQAETSPGASNDELEFFAANGASTTTRVALIDQYQTSINGNLFVSPVTDGVNLAKLHSESQGLTDNIFYGAKNVNSFVQLAAHNVSAGASASTDFIVYADTGDNSEGFMDMGICSTGFSDPNYGITRSGDGYIFLSAPKFANTVATGGNLVLATEGGAYGDIVFAAGGFVDGTEQGRFVAGQGFEAQANIVSLGGQIYQGQGAQALLNSANVTTTLNGAINSSVTTITVASTTGFLNHGALYIDSETLYYTGKTGTQFNGISRGTSQTTAASHLNGGTIYQPQAGLTDAQLVMQGSSNSFVQAALKNTNAGSSASTDMILYTSNGDNNSGWIDMGVTSETFSDSNYGVTGPDDGYIFMSAPRGSVGGGNLFLSTSDTGYYNDIVFSTNGFGAGNVRMRIVGLGRAGTPAGVDVNIATTSTSTTTGALRVAGGVGIVGNLNVGGNFNLTGNISIGGSGTTTTTTTLVVDNPITFLANANNADAVDIGLSGQYKPGAANVYTGFARDTTTKSWRLFDGLATKPTTTVSWAGTTPGALYVGSATVANSTASTNTTTGALIVTGGVGVGGAIYGGGDLVISSNTQATSTVTGAFKVKGGAAIEQGVLYVGGSTGNSAVLTGNINAAGYMMPLANVTYDIGSGTTWWRSLYMGGNIYSAADIITGSNTQATSTTTGALKVKGGMSLEQGVLYVGGATGNSAVMTGNINVAGYMMPLANVTYDIGSGTTWWRTFYGVSTQAKYADLAENYQADKVYPPGTVVMFGGAAEVTLAEANTTAVAGVVSHNPAHLMNGGLQGTNVIPLALQGRVPCNVIGPVKKGDMMVSAGFGYARSSSSPQIGQVIGKALADFPSQSKGQIEVVVGRL